MTRWACRVLLSTAALSLSAAADPATPYVYTNSDLERFAVPEPSPPATGRVADPYEGISVADFLEREYARLATLRALDLARARLDAESRSGNAREAYAPAHGPYWAYHGGWRPCVPRLHSVSPRPLRPVAGDRARGIRPLHAGPTAAELRGAQGRSRHGSDAFPR